MRAILTTSLVFGWLSAAPLALAAEPQPRDMAVDQAIGLPITDMAASGLHSKYTAQDYALIVSLPKDYAKGNKRYPVLYLLDGNRNSLLGALMRDRLKGDIEEMIVVGVGYVGEVSDDPGPPVNQRWLDYPTPAKSYWTVPEGQGAPTFFQALSKEIIPYIDGKYRTDPAHRGLGGHSLGGFFTMWALFHSEGLFSRYWISSPSMVWDGGVLDREEAAYAARHTDLKATVFADAGGVEDLDMTEGLRALGQKIQGRGYPGLRWQFRLAPDVGHSGAMPESAIYAFYALYGPPQTQLSGDQLRAISGHYDVAPGQGFDIVIEGGDAYLKASTVPAFRTAYAKLIPTAGGALVLRYVGLTFAPKAGPGPVEQLTVRHSFEGRAAKDLIAVRKAAPSPTP